MSKVMTYYPHKCKWCGQSFTTFYKTTNFCSKQCKSLWLHEKSVKNNSKVCPICGKEFFGYRKNQVCCSQKCAGIRKANESKGIVRTRPNKVCPTCGKPFHGDGNRKYCSVPCAASGQRARFDKKYCDFAKIVVNDYISGLFQEFQPIPGKVYDARRFKSMNRDSPYNYIIEMNGKPLILRYREVTEITEGDLTDGNHHENKD